MAFLFHLLPITLHIPKPEQHRFTREKETVDSRISNFYFQGVKCVICNPPTQIKFWKELDKYLHQYIKFLDQSNTGSKASTY